jgi:hypothetical protein
MLFLEKWPTWGAAHMECYEMYLNYVRYICHIYLLPGMWMVGWKFSIGTLTTMFVSTCRLTATVYTYGPIRDQSFCFVRMKACAFT